MLEREREREKERENHYCWSMKITSIYKVSLRGIYIYIYTQVDHQ